MAYMLYLPSPQFLSLISYRKIKEMRIVKYGYK